MLFTAKCWICKAEKEGYEYLDSDPAYRAIVCSDCYNAHMNGVDLIP